MTWSYTAPTSGNKDAVRFLIGDTDTTDQQLSDEEITYVLSQYSSLYMAAANCCDALANKFSRQVQKTVGKISLAANQRATAYREAAALLRSKRNAEGLAMFIGGRSLSDKQSFGDNADAVQPSFAIGMDDFPETRSDIYPPYTSGSK